VRTAYQSLQQKRNATAIGPCVREGRFVETQTCLESRSWPGCREASRTSTTINNAKGAKTPFRTRSNALRTVMSGCRQFIFPAQFTVLGAKWPEGEATLNGHLSMHSEKDTRKRNVETMRLAHNVAQIRPSPKKSRILRIGFACLVVTSFRNSNRSREIAVNILDQY
jgi:hypothetical protein